MSTSQVKRVSVKLVKSPIGCIPKHRATVRALGLRRMQQVREHELTPVIKGMLRQVYYLVNIKEVEFGK